MGTIRISIPSSMMHWVRETYEPIFNNEWHFKPTDSQLITHALYEVKATRTGRSIEIRYNPKKKCFIIKER